LWSIAVVAFDMAIVVAVAPAIVVAIVEFAAIDVAIVDIVAPTVVVVVVVDLVVDTVVVVLAVDLVVGIVVFVVELVAGIVAATVVIFVAIVVEPFWSFGLVVAYVAPQVVVSPTFSISFSTLLTSSPFFAAVACQFCHSSIAFVALCFVASVAFVVSSTNCPFSFATC